MAADTTKEIVDIVESKGLSFDQCRRQGCDRTAQHIEGGFLQS